MRYRLSPCLCAQESTDNLHDDCLQCQGLGYILYSSDGKERLSPTATSRGLHTELLWGVCCALARMLTELRRDVTKASEDASRALHERDRAGEASNEFYSSSLSQSNLLRDELKATLRQLSGIPDPGKRYNKTAAVDEDLVGSIRRMVRAEVRDVAGDALSPERIRDFVRTLIDSNAKQIVRKALGLGDGYHDKITGPLAERVNKAMGPAIDASFASIQTEIDAICVTPPEFKGEIRDVFVRSFRTRVIREAELEADRLAKEVMTSQAREVILEEMPWLRKYIVLERLGAPEAEVDIETGES